MIKILIIEKDKDKCKEMINNISMFNNNIKINCIAYTIEEAVSIIKNTKIDLIIIGSSVNEDTSKFINIIISENLEEYKKSIIVYCSEKLELNKKEKEYVLEYYAEPINYIQLEKSINYYYLEREKNKDLIIRKIYQELKGLNFKLSYHGTQYLADCIYEIYIRKNKLNLNLVKDIYPIIAQKYDKSINTIHNNIKNSINAMYYDCDEKMLIKYFECHNIIERPRPKELMFKISKNI